MIASKAARMRSIVVPEAENSRDPRFALADVKSFRHCWHSLLRTCSAKTAGGCNNRCHAASYKIKTLFHFNCNFFPPSMLVTGGVIVRQ